MVALREKVRSLVLPLTKDKLILIGENYVSIILRF